MAWLLVDVGSSSVRCTAVAEPFTSTGAGAGAAVSSSLLHGAALSQPLAAARTPVALAADGTADAALLAGAVTATVRACSAALPRGTRVHCVLPCTFAAALVGLSTSDGAPATPLFTYANRDARAPGVLAQLKAACDERAHWDRTGAPLHAAYAPVFTRLAALDRLAAGGAEGGHAGAEPPAPRRLLWTSLSGFLLSLWAGLPAAEVGMSLAEAGWAGLLSTASLGYDAGALAAAGLTHRCLPPIRAAGWGVSVPAAALVQRGLLAAGCGGSGDSSDSVTLALALGDGAAATYGSAALAGGEGGRAPLPADALLAGRVDAAHAPLLPPAPPSPPPQPSLLVCLTVGTSAAVRVLLPRSELLRALCSCSSSSSSSSSAPAAAIARGPAHAVSNAAGWGARCPDCGRSRLSSTGLFVYPVSDATVLLGGALTDGGALLATLASLAAGECGEGSEPLQGTAGGDSGGGGGGGGAGVDAPAADAGGAPRVGGRGSAHPPTSPPQPALRALLERVVHSLRAAQATRRRSGGEGDAAATCELSSCVAPSSVLCLPFWSGERSTGWDASARGVFAGLDPSNTRPHHLLHAAMDAVAFRLRAILDSMARLVPQLAHAPVVCCGGALSPVNNPVWAHIVAAALGRALWVEQDDDSSQGAPASAPVEATTLGTAVFHALHSGSPHCTPHGTPHPAGGQSLSAAPPVARPPPHSQGQPAAADAAALTGRRLTVVAPTAEAVSLYEAARSRHERLYELFSASRGSGSSAAI